MPSAPVLTPLTLARLAAGYQQQELARIVGVSASRLCEYERGVRPPAAARAALARALDYPVEALFPNRPIVSEATTRGWLVSRNDGGSAARPSPVKTSAVRGRHGQG